MVDFGICLAQTSTLALGLEQMTDGLSHPTYNHFESVPLSRRPIAISIVTTIEGEGRGRGHVQLGVWADAHFRNLIQLLTRFESEPDLEDMALHPLMVIQGPLWCMSFAKWELGVMNEPQTHVYERIVIGNATTADGVLNIISALLLLYEWAETVYRPWFEQNVCIGPAAAQSIAAVKIAAATTGVDAKIATSLQEQESSDEG